MANTQAQFGFRHIGYLGGGAPDYQLTARTLQSTYATKIGYGDPVARPVTGTTNYLIQASPPTGNNATAMIEGIFQGTLYVPSGSYPQYLPYWPGAASVDATGYIIDAPNAQFLVAALLTSAVTADIGKVVNFTSGTPSTVGAGLSTATIDMATATNNLTATWLPFKIVDIFKGVGNGSDPTTNYGWAIVTFNNQQYRAGQF